MPSGLRERVQEMATSGSGVAGYVFVGAGIGAGRA
jgi:hypothetical protein